MSKGIMSNQERLTAMRWLLNKAAKRYKKPGILEMPLNLEDRGNENEILKQYSMCYPIGESHFKKLAGPDWTFVNWPSANIQSYRISSNLIRVKSFLPPKVNKIFWAGNIHSPLKDVPEFQTRPRLLKIGNDHIEDFDIRHISPVDGQIPKKDQNYFSIHNLTKYKYLIDIGGNGYSGRLKYLMFSKRPILIVDRRYVEYFFEELIPFEHFIPVKQDLSNLIEMANWLHEHQTEAEKIAINMYNFALNNFSRSKLLARINSVYEDNFI
jgi:hypothetical protein